MFNTWMTDPEAFQTDYEEYQELLQALAEPSITEGDLCDIVREYEENLTDEQREEVNAQREEEWLKFYDTGIEFPYEM